MDKVVCKICNSEFDEKAFNKHLKAHKKTIESYYRDLYPKYDKLTGEPIIFKSKEFYFSNFFNSKENLITWFKVAGDKDKIDYITEFLKLRKERKGLKYHPCQVELKTLMMPSKNTMASFCNFKDICNCLGLEERFDSFLAVRSGVKPKDCKIITDSREQNPLNFRQEISYGVEGLKYGDYRLDKNVITNSHCVIERKSPQDFVGTFSNGFERFQKEVDRAIKDRSYLVVMVEESLSKMIDFKNKCEVFRKIKIGPDYVFRNVRDLLEVSNQIQFLFVISKKESERIAEKLLYDGTIHIGEDLQYLYDSGKL